MLESIIPNDRSQGRIIERKQELKDPVQNGLRVPFNIYNKFANFIYRVGLADIRLVAPPGWTNTNPSVERDFTDRSYILEIEKQAKKPKVGLRGVEAALEDARVQIQKQDELAREFLHQYTVGVDIPDLGEQSIRVSV